MTHLFVPYPIALKLKEMGFDKECNAFYQQYAIGKTMYWNFIKYLNYNLNPNRCSAPIYQQVIDWLEITHNCHLDRVWYNDKVTPPRWVYSINHLYAGSDWDEAILEALDIIEKGTLEERYM